MSDQEPQDRVFGSRTMEDYVRGWTGYKACACEGEWLCPLCDLKQLLEGQRSPVASPHAPQPTMADAAEMLWVVLANVSGGDWTQQSAEWQEYAAKWRDYYFAALTAERLAGPGASDQCDHSFEELARAIQWCKKCGCVQTDEGDTFYLENRCP